MRIIIVGAGKLGFEIARLLSEEAHDVVVIDSDEGALTAVDDNLDVLAVHGNGAVPRVLSEAGVHDAGLLIAVAAADEVNIIACMTAKRMGVPVCAARVRNGDYLGGAETVHAHMQFGIDAVINPERTAAVEIARIVKTPHATQVDYFVGGRVSVIGLKVEQGAPITAGSLSVIRPRRCILAAVVRKNDMFIPRGDTTIAAGDRIYVVAHTGDFGAVRALSGTEARPLRRLTVVGGGRIGQPLVRLFVRGLRRGTDITLIERDEFRCTALAAQLPDDVLIIGGDGAQTDVLHDAMVTHNDAFIAVTGDDATNLLAVMAAKELDVGETVAALSRQDYLPLAQRAGVDATVVPRLITAGTLLQLVRKHPVVSLTLLEDGRAEAVEVVVERGAPAERRQLQQLRSLQEAVVGAVVRHNRVILPDGSTRIEAGDHVVLFGMARSLAQSEALFRA